jgi:hypothetical protein
MSTAIILFIIIFVIYQVAKPKESKQVKMSAFDAYLIEQYKESQKKADAIPVITSTSIVNTSTKNKSWTNDLYLGMIKCGKYDINDLRKEAMEVMNVTETELDEMLENYKSNKKKK